MREPRRTLGLRKAGDELVRESLRLLTFPEDPAGIPLWWATARGATSFEDFLVCEELGLGGFGGADGVAVELADGVSDGVATGFGGSTRVAMADLRYEAGHSFISDIKMHASRKPFFFIYRSPFTQHLRNMKSASPGVKLSSKIPASLQSLANSFPCMILSIPA
jgi:hypothetical protein